MAQIKTQTELRLHFKISEKKHVLKNCNNNDIEYTIEYVNWLEKLVLNKINVAIPDIAQNLTSERVEISGYVKITGCDKASGFNRICKESDLQKVGKEIFREHPGEDGYYGFTKFLWVNFPDDRDDSRLDSIVTYDA